MQKPPSTIRLLPQHVSSVQDFYKLSNNHKCEECEDGALFNNYYEMVQYPDPGPCGGTSGRPVVTCPNNPNSRVTILPSRDDVQKRPWWFKTKTYKCDLCSVVFPQMRSLMFHRNRKHRVKDWFNWNDLWIYTVPMQVDVFQCMGGGIVDCKTQKL